MPSFSHDGLVRLFSDRPELAVELLRDVLRIEIPSYTELRTASADATDVKPATRHADLVVVLAADGAPVLAIIVEVQLDTDADKPFTWPAYLCDTRDRLRCPVELLVFTPSKRVADWAARQIPIGQGYVRPLVIGPAGVPPVTDHDAARRDPELAVLSASAHGRDPIEQAVPVALAALAAVAGFSDERALLYSDVVMAGLSEAARTALEELMRTEGYQYQSEFARRHQAEGEARGEARGRAEGEARGRAEGEARGRAEGEARAVLTVLDARGLAVTDEQRQRIVASTDLDELERWLRKAATVSNADALFD